MFNQYDHSPISFNLCHRTLLSTNNWTSWPDLLSKHQKVNFLVQLTKSIQSPCNVIFSDWVNTHKIPNNDVLLKILLIHIQTINKMFLDMFVCPFNGGGLQNTYLCLLRYIYPLSPRAPYPGKQSLKGGEGVIKVSPYNGVYNIYWLLLRLFLNPLFFSGNNSLSTAAVNCNILRKESYKTLWETEDHLTLSRTM